MSATAVAPLHRPEILATARCGIHHAGSQGNTGGGISGQMTQGWWPRSEHHRGTVFFVREGIYGGELGHFMIASNQRLAMKRGRVPRGFIQVLHLAAPDAVWDAIAEAVQAADPLHRPVRRHARWTMKSAGDAMFPD